MKVDIEVLQSHLPFRSCTRWLKSTNVSSPCRALKQDNGVIRVKSVLLNITVQLRYSNRAVTNLRNRTHTNC